MAESELPRSLRAALREHADAIHEQNLDGLYAARDREDFEHYYREAVATIERAGAPQVQKGEQA